MPSIDASDLDRMRSNLLFDGPDRSTKLSRFWSLLILSACIGAAGVVADSTATVIGAMIIAPLMVPIMGSVLAITTSDRDNLARSVILIIGGAAAAIVIGYLFGMINPIAVTADTSSQVSTRVSPRLIDLLAALATGAAGAFAQCRDDVSDTLPGVAIAISLVPPLAVVGLTLEAGELAQATGALLLFATNVGAILLSGVIVMAVFGVHTVNLDVPTRPLNRRRAIQFVVMLAVIITLPLAAATSKFIRDRQIDAKVSEAASAWSAESDWTVIDVTRVRGAVQVTASGPAPFPSTADLRRQLIRAGLGEMIVTVRMIPEEKIELPGG
ncbi:MAG TPA: DUF389 domain-containing protein [Actinomycetota bacterium]|nr:DUF389 domain-containing protein [Acidimicrobiales bacterium]HPJ20200.1 DUF389 domain-containing protein [Actinomycetota bacterium]